MLSSEELLKPRFKVIAPYPDSPFKVGDILRLHPRSFKNPTSTQRWTTKPELPEFDAPIILGHVDRFPALFQPLQWWEERAVEDLPEYVECARTPDQEIMPGDVLKIREWFCGTCGRTTHKGDDHAVCVLDNNCFLPATLADYTAYQNQTK